MRCLSYGTLNCSKKKTITMIFCILFGFVIFYILNVFFLEMALSASGLRVMIIQIISFLNMIALSMGIYFIRQNHLLRKQLYNQQKVAQEFCIQRDIDMLSGLKNRNSFVRLAQQIEKRGDMVSIMMCDIDGLKIINDTLGHRAGDKIIQEAAEILKKSFPINTEIFRIGGDEYLAIIKGVLPDNQISGIQEKIKQLIVHYNEVESAIPLSMSFGFACSSPNMRVFGEVEKQADYVMYQAKRASQDSVYRQLTAKLIKK